MELAVPESLYGLAILEPAVLNRKHDGNLMYFVEIGRVFFMLSLSYLLSALFLLKVWRMNQSHAMSQCSNNLLLLENACVFLFEVTIVKEVHNTLTMMSILWMAPWPKTLTKSSGQSGYLPTLFTRGYAQAGSDSPKSGAVLAAENPEGRFSGMLKKLRPPSSSSSSQDESQWKLDGIGCFFRTWSLFAVALPKLILEILLAYIGGVYIIKSESEGDMVMNTLAVVFIADIDLVLYRAFTSNVIKFNLAHMKTVDVELSNKTRVAMWLASSVLCPLVTVAASALIVFRSKARDCSNFEFSWREALEGLIKE